MNKFLFKATLTDGTVTGMYVYANKMPAHEQRVNRMFMAEKYGIDYKKTEYCGKV